MSRMDIKKGLEEIESILPNGWREQARETGALIRGRKVKSAEDLLLLILIYFTVAGSFGKTSEILKATSDMALDKNAVYVRVLHSGEWLRWMAETMGKEDGVIMEKPKWLQDHNIILVDGSEVVAKDDKTQQGGKNRNYWLHYAMDLFHFQCRNLSITPISEGENLRRHTLYERDISIADRGYCSIKSMEYAREHKADFLLRYRTNAFKLYNQEGQEIDILSQCQSLEPKQSTSFAAYYQVGSGRKVVRKPVRVVVRRKDDESAAKSARRQKRRDCRKQIKSSAQAKEFNRYIVLVTSLLDMTVEQILELYRARWQIEEVFYRLKGLLNFGEIPCKKEEAVLAWLYGKLFIAFVLERLLKRGVFPPSAILEDGGEG